MSDATSADPVAKFARKRPVQIEQFALARASGKASSAELVDRCLDRIFDPQGEGARTFVKVWAERARIVAGAVDQLTDQGYAPSPMAGIPVAVKDLLDVAGERTTAASHVLENAIPAQADAPVVARLKRAGAVLVGST